LEIMELNRKEDMEDQQMKKLLHLHLSTLIIRNSARNRKRRYFDKSTWRPLFVIWKE